MNKIITMPLNKSIVKEIRAGDICKITGTIYSARDAAHRRMSEEIAKALGVSIDELLAEPDGFLSEEQKKLARAALPFDITAQTIYYLGPTPARPGQVIGSAGPTTSTRMDKYTPLLLELGMSGMIGKGRRGDSVKASMKKNTAVYFAATGGAGALLSKCIKSSEIIAYEDLGTEAIRKLYVEDLPVIAVTDCYGTDAYS